MYFFICSNIVKEIYKIVKKTFNLNEAIDYYLDNLQISTDDSDNEGDSKFQSAKISIQPPVNANSENSDIESGDEDQPTGDASTLIGNQLLSSAVVQINTPSGRVTREDEEEQSNKN